MTDVNYAENMAQLEQAIRDLAASIQNAASMRKTHPSYGYTKTAIKADYNKLEGMMCAWAYVAGAYKGSHLFSASTMAMARLRVNLLDIRDQVRDC